MRALALTAPLTFSAVLVDAPSRPGPGRVVIRTLAGGICGSDGPFVKGRPARWGRPHTPNGIAPAGFPMHEVAGVVVDAGGSDLSEGDHVVGWATGLMVWRSS